MAGHEQPPTREDAGEYTDRLRRILLRIPDGRGRRISTDKGWYPIIARLDEELAALDPEYQVLRVKEKFGGLRYHFRTDIDELRGPMNDLVEAAETAAEHTCEECGNTDVEVRLRTDSRWCKTLCNRCADRRPDRTLRPT